MPSWVWKTVFRSRTANTWLIGLTPNASPGVRHRVMCSPLRGSCLRSVAREAFGFRHFKPASNRFDRDGQEAVEALLNENLHGSRTPGRVNHGERGKARAARLPARGAPARAVADGFAVGKPAEGGAAALELQ